MGLVIEPDRLFTGAARGAGVPRRPGVARCHLLARRTLLEDLGGIEAVDTGADAVLLGDLGEGMTFARLNPAFRLLLDGAELVTLARNRYWKHSGGLMLDIGAFAAALEYGSGKKATLVGKPAPAFFANALASLGIAPSEAAVIGDDLESDVHGGQAAGMKGILVRTGKFRSGDLEGTHVRPDVVLDSLADSRSRALIRSRPMADKTPPDEHAARVDESFDALHATVGDRLDDGSPRRPRPVAHGREREGRRGFAQAADGAAREPRLAVQGARLAPAGRHAARRAGASGVLTTFRHSLDHEFVP